MLCATRLGADPCDCGAGPKRLPVLNAASHAASTAFCLAEVVNPDDPGRSLWVDGNGKITRGGGTYAAPMPNAFSLVQVDDCPYSTPTCRDGCYVHNLEAAAKATHDRYRANSALVRDILAPGADMFLSTSWALALARWVRASTPTFRWHVSGDLWSNAYASWVASVIEVTPKVDHWIYTRSFRFVSHLGGLPNVSVNLSADQDNYRAAVKELDAWDATVLRKRMRIAYYTRTGSVPSDLPEDSVIFPDYSLRGAKGGDPADQRADSAWWQSLTGDQRRMVCPVDFYGAAEDRRCGPCGRCL